jgi:HPt (histidine-containing phosphotransfer) domain-containing protein
MGGFTVIDEYIFQYKNVGNDYVGMIERFDGNLDLFEQMIRLFMQDKTIEDLQQHVNDQEYEKAFHDAHTLKGVAGNLGLTALHMEASAMTEKLRVNDTTDVEKHLAKVEEEYTAFKEMAEKYL